MPFALFCNDLIPSGCRIADLGCGNGRDANWLASVASTRL
jgi:hypothetical protein